jgi:hypothetical protein
MMHRRRQAKYSPATGAAGSDTDALQTDVMRFMSIIGLCLMAVFALVQGLPLQEPAKSAQPAAAARIRQEVRTLQQQVQALQGELQALRSAMDQARQALTDSQRNLRQAEGQALQARKERDRLQDRLQAMGRQLERQRQELAAIEDDSRENDQDPGELRQRLLRAQRQLEDSRKEVEALQRPPQRQAASPASVPPATTEPAPRAVAEKKGFSLRFESDAALDRLVEAGRVSLYAMADHQAWRLTQQAGVPAVAPAAFPGWFHEMSAATVPTHYLHSLEQAASGPAQTSVVWGVQLPPTTRTAIASLMHARQGGALLIRADGQVILEE